MKFLLEYVICCTSSSSARESSPSSPAADNSSLLVSVLPPKSRHYCNRRKRRTSASKSGSEPDWRPSLNAISEDNVVAIERRNRSSTVSERILKQRVSSTHKSPVQHRRSDEYGRAPIPGILPAFSPTPFLF